MDMMDYTEKDKIQTRTNREKLFHNRNLLLWYKNLYIRQFSRVDNIHRAKILEIGSGTSPLKLFYPHVLTSDILDLDYLDYIFDCHHIDRFEAIEDGSLDIITMTNVLHHLKAPVAFLIKASRKLKPGGKVIMTEPYFSVISTVVYKRLHHEPVRFDIDEPLLDEVKGPLTSANIALPYLIFFSNKQWRDQLYLYYDFSVSQIFHYTSLAYMATGGISRKFSLPASSYRLIFDVDTFLADRFPKLFSAFFILEMIRKLE